MFITFSLVTARAETNTTASSGSSSGSTQAAANPFGGAYDGLNAARTPNLPPPPAVTPAQPAPQQQQDRKQGQGAAAAMAAAAAAMAMMSCMQMMNEARKMPPGPEKRMMMMMAQQQCAQAAQNAANAAQNKEGQKQLSQQDVPKQAELQAPQQLQAPKGGEEKNLLAQSGNNTEEEKLELPNIDDLLDRPTASLDDSLVSDPPVGETGATWDFDGASYSKLQPLEKANQKFDENANGGKPTPEGSGIAGNYNFSSNGALSPDALKKLSAIEGASAGVAEGGGRRGLASSGEGGETNGFDGGGEKSGEPSAFDQMLSQLMGGAPGEGGAFGAGAGHDFVNLPVDQKKKQQINIFQYASYRYQFATYNDGRVKVRPTKHGVRTSHNDAR